MVKFVQKRTDKYLKNYQLKRNFDVQLAKNKFLQLMFFSDVSNIRKYPFSNFSGFVKKTIF